MIYLKQREKESLEYLLDFRLHVAIDSFILVQNIIMSTTIAQLQPETSGIILMIVWISYALSILLKGYRTFQPQTFQPQAITLDFSNPEFSTMNSSTPDPYGVEKFVVERSGVERSRL